MNVDIERISLVNDYISVSDEVIKKGDSELQYCVRTMGKNLVFLLKKKQEVAEPEMDKCLYELTYMLQCFESLLKEAEEIRKKVYDYFKINKTL